MSSTSSTYESDSETELEDDFDIEPISASVGCDSLTTSSLEDESQLCADDPVADEEWTTKYEEELRQDEERNQLLQQRLDGLIKLSEWCKCGKCDITTLQNISECYCCTEIEDCVDALKSDLVQQDLPENTELHCVTEHPGFRPICLEKWSLRSTAWKYKTKQKKRYTQTGDEESFLRSISYREFTRLVYGMLGNTRLPLPACAYSAIRKTFPTGKDEIYVGFELDDI